MSSGLSPKDQEKIRQMINNGANFDELRNTISRLRREYEPEMWPDFHRSNFAFITELKAKNCPRTAEYLENLVTWGNGKIIKL